MQLHDLFSIDFIARTRDKPDVDATLIIDYFNSVSCLCLDKLRTNEALVDRG
jgi:hypothetical protein